MRGGVKVLLDITKGIDKINDSIKCTYHYATGYVKKQNDGSYLLYYNAGGGTSGGTFTIDIPKGYNGFVARTKNTSKYNNLTISVSGKKVCSSSKASERNTMCGFGYYGELTTDKITIDLGGQYDQGRQEASFEIDYLAFIK